MTVNPKIERLQSPVDAGKAARSLDRCLRARARHTQAHRPQRGSSNRGPLAPTGIYQIVARRGRQCGVTAYPHRFRHHFSHTWLDRGGAERDLMKLNGWTSPRCSPGMAPAPAAPAPAAATTASWTTPPDPAIASRRLIYHPALNPPTTPIAESARTNWPNCAGYRAQKTRFCGRLPFRGGGVRCARGPL